MTPPETQQVPVSPHGGGQDRLTVRRKAVLFCPTCDHENPVDGDWEVHEDHEAGTCQLACPVCGTPVVTRSLSQEHEDTEPALAVELFQRTVQSWGELWRRSLETWLPGSNRSDC